MRQADNETYHSGRRSLVALLRDSTDMWGPPDFLPCYAVCRMERLSVAIDEIQRREKANTTCPENVGVWKVSNKRHVHVLGSFQNLRVATAHWPCSGISVYRIPFFGPRSLQ